MGTMTLQLLRIVLARDADDQPKVSFGASLDPGKGVLYYNRPYWLNPKEPCRQQERIRGGFPGKSLLMNHIAVDAHLEEFVQLGGPQDSGAVLARGDHGNLESIAAELMDESHASLIRLHARLRDGIVDQVILAVPEPAHGFDLCRIFKVSLGEFDAARFQEVTNAIETRLPIHVKPVVDVDIEGAKCFPLLPRTLLQILIERLFPTLRVEAGCIRDDAIQVKKDSIVPVAVDALGRGVRHESLSSLPKDSLAKTQAISYPSIWPLEPLLWPRSQDEDKANPGRVQSRSVAGEWKAVVPLCRPLTFHTVSLCLIATTLTSISLPSRQTLSASVERTATDAVSCPHLQPVISGISSPYRAMNAL